MKRQAFQPGEIRDENDAIIREGAYGKKSAFATADNKGILDYMINNFDALKDAIDGGRVYVASASDLPATGDIANVYIANDTGKWYYWDPATSKYVTIDNARTVANDAISARDTAKAWAESSSSPDGATDADSSTGKTQSSKSWALYSKDRATASASSASASASSASAAKTSQSAAASSASAAASSASAAKSSQTAAATSETNAKASEKAAASSANTAKTSQNAAASSASQAEISATDAANSAASLTYATADEAKTGIADNRIISPSTLKSTINYMTNQLQRNKKYAVGDIAYSPNLPSWAYLECTTAGTTGASEPDFSSVSSTGAIADMTDGNTHWRVRDTRCRYEVGDIIAKTATPKSYEYLLPCNGASFDKTKYPLLAKVFANGKVPNLTDGRFLEGSTSAGTSKNAGLPNITGTIGGGSGAGAGSGNGLFRSTHLNGALVATASNNYGDNFPVFSQTRVWPDGQPIIQAKFDASLSNDIYGASNTVQPKSYTVVYYVCYGG